MKKNIITTMVIGLTVLLGFGSAYAADATVGVDVNSAYVWRGITFNDGFVIQPSIDVTEGGFGLNVWGNIDGDDYDDTLDSGEFSEVDITLSYGFDLEPVGVTVGYIEYLFPAGGLGTRELFLSLGMDIVGALSGGLDIYYDFDEVETFYMNLSLAYSASLNEKTSLDLGAGIGYAGDEYCADGDSGLYDYILSAGLSYAVSDSLSLGAAINYADSVDEDKLPDQDADFFGGVSIYYGF
jgi:opacity protein-like surface antigen